MAPSDRIHEVGQRVLAVAALAVSAHAIGEPFIVKNGAANAEIVVADDAANMTRLAASQLQQHLLTMSGAKLPIVEAPTAGSAVKVYVGPSAHTRALGIAVDDLNHDAYRMISGDGYLALVGRDTPFHQFRGETATELLRLAALKSGDKERDELWQRWYKLSGGNWGLPYSQLWRDHNRELGVNARDEHGSFSAVADFLRSLGMRWYMPGEIGQVIPQRKSIALPKLNRTVRPDFPVRFANQRRFGSSRDEALWELWMGFSRATEILDATFPQHGITAVTDTRTSRSLFAHPNAATPKPEDYYVMYGGKRHVQGRVFHGKRSGAKQCLSSPGLLAENLRYARARFDICESPMVSVMPGDGYTSICQCERCKGKDSPELGYRGLLSDYVWGYVEAVARDLNRTHPGRKVLGTAYGTYVHPPSDTDRFSPNVIVCICQHREHFGQRPDTQKTYSELRKRYLEKLPEGQPVLLMYEYYRGTRHTPHYNPHAIADDLRALKGICLGDMIDVRRDGLQDLKRDGYTPQTRMSVQHLDLYVTGRFLWDTGLDVDAMLDEYCALFYGPAAAEMKALVEYGEANWMDILGDKKRIDRTLALLEAVRAKPPPDSVHGRRVALVADYLAPLTKLREQVGIERIDVPELIVQDRTGQRITIDGRLDDPLWSGIHMWSKGELKDLTTGERPKRRTRFLAGWANGNLYFGIHCHEAKGEKPVVTATEPDQMSLWMGDCVEILLEPPGHSYYQIAISPTGAVTDLDRARDKTTRLEWESEIEVATQIEERAWTVEIRIPAAGAEQDKLLPFQGVAGNQPTEAFPWYVNVCRQRKRGDDMELSAFSPTAGAKGGFHRPEKFAKLYVGRKKPPKQELELRDQ